MKIRLNDFTAVRYRGISGLHLDRLAKCNLILGANGIGKTALLEAMWLFAGRFTPTLLWSANVQRAPNRSLNPIARLTDDRLELHGTENDEHHSIRYEFEPLAKDAQAIATVAASKEDAPTMPPIIGRLHTLLDNRHLSKGNQRPSVTPAGLELFVPQNRPADRPDCAIETSRSRHDHDFSSELPDRYSELVKLGHKSHLVETLNIVLDGISDVELLTHGTNNPLLWVTDSAGALRPIHDLGRGAEKLVRLLLDFSSSQGGIVFSDELEIGLHYSAHALIWKTLMQWLDQWSVQFFATTHDWELLTSAIDAFEGDLNSLAIHRLYLDSKRGCTSAVTFTGETLAGVRDLNLEIR